MNCPRCSAVLDDHILQGKIYHKCDGCGGLWFDRGELAQIKQEKNWFTIDSAANPSAARINEGDMKCPRDGFNLRSIEYEHETGVKVDICPECEGLWLDAGEVKAIHKAGETWLQRLKDTIEEELIAVELFLIRIGPYLPK
ncbi:MAG: zf-TFIIB domain-containing protein [Elusimicrobia bacterium]|nr:zf-TFIIB domain-containing protein [Elusimicrobiota bacterium]